MFCADEIDESITYIAQVLEVAGEIEEVVAVFEEVIYLIGEVVHGVFVGDVADHDGGARVGIDILLLYLELRVRLDPLLETNRF
jgi:hypothetical protein